MEFETMFLSSFPLASLIEKADKFAEEKHSKQVRKYNNEPYIEHCRRVANLVAEQSNDQEIVAAALLHDVVEDCGVTIDTVIKEFTPYVGLLVLCLTEASRGKDGNRAERKKVDRVFLSKVPNDAKLIKLADIIDNLSDLKEQDPKFAKIFAKECELLLPYLYQASGPMTLLAENLIYDTLAK